MAVRSKTRRWQEAFGTREVRGRGFEDRRPKVEDRKKAEFRNPKTETRGRARFGFRPSGFGLLSAFDLRPSDLTRWLGRGGSS